ncbi:putative ABC transporter substrate binding protein [Anaerolinea thermophila UNI-1]|uniref:ABC transporter substrate binding protein n=2 Tax=Anaerolinea thermophila TaxID=167964 RepID=E8N5X9_ANATU|nr:putative ABC transporter substrate binding protein [Anaerolinea thermophila UNI-1]
MEQMKFSLDHVLAQLPRPPRRVVSLVPSYTESLFELGFGSSVVGITDYCIHPSNALKNIPRVGGPKNARLESILSLEPELVLANPEENPADLVFALFEKGIPVWVSFPQTVQDAIQFLWGLVDLYRDKQAALKVRVLEQSWEFARQVSESLPRFRYFCPVWEETLTGQIRWITFNDQTYPADLLSLFGGENIFGAKQKEKPSGEGQDLDLRYPVVTPDEVCSGDPEVILLPDEPFSFESSAVERFIKLFQNTPAVKKNRIWLIPGDTLFWYGVRLGKALSDFPEVFSSLYSME